LGERLTGGFFRRQRDAQSLPGCGKRREAKVAFADREATNVEHLVPRQPLRLTAIAVVIFEITVAVMRPVRCRVVRHRLQRRERLAHVALLGIGVAEHCETAGNSAPEFLRGLIDVRIKPDQAGYRMVPNLYAVIVVLPLIELERQRPNDVGVKFDRSPPCRELKRVFLIDRAPCPRLAAIPLAPELAVG
jgi:hypothetical protein